MDQDHLDIARVMSRLRAGPTSELEIQHMLRLRPTTARKICDDLVTLGVAYRNNRELHITHVELKADPDFTLCVPIMERLMRSPGTALSLATELEADTEVVRATCESMREHEVISASTCGPLLIYRLS